MKEQQTPPVLPGFVRLGGPEDVTTALGPLARLVGTWIGNHGWNLIAVPKEPDKPGGPESFTLLVRPYFEFITFAPLGAPVPDRGASETLLISGLEYSLRVTDALTNQPLHLENGMWLYLNDPQNPQSPTIARHATVPHGNSVLALGGFSQSDGPPDIPTLDSFPVGSPGGMAAGYTDPYIEPLPPAVAAIQPHFIVKNPNAVLQAAIQEQTILDTLTLNVSSQTATGGIVNIPFIRQNANASAFNATFWIETVKDPQTGDQYDQLQYSQQTNLNFIPRGDGQGLIMWPHVNVNTLVKQ
ncbi:MAG TPA: heme-binding protein [Pyrinomonadaceae bacterium]|nr:heme-binding protein [Pyrinomonadaceae bacterium]